MLSWILSIFLFFVDFTHTLRAWIWWNQRAQEVWSGLNCIKFSRNTPKVILQISTTCFWRPPKIAFLTIFAIFAYPIPVFVDFTRTLRAWIWWNQRAQEVWSGLNYIRFSKKPQKAILQISATCFWRPPKMAFLTILAIFAYPIPQLWAKMDGCKQIPGVPQFFPLQSAHNEQPRSRVRWRYSIMTIVWPPLLHIAEKSLNIAVKSLNIAVKLLNIAVKSKHLWKVTKFCWKVAKHRWKIA